MPNIKNGSGSLFPGDDTGYSLNYFVETSPEGAARKET